MFFINLIISFKKEFICIQKIIFKIQNQKKQKNYNNQIVQKTSKYQKIYKFKVSQQNGHEFQNNEADAFKHTFLGADLSLRYNNTLSLLLGYFHEYQTPNNPSGEKNMDLWNNQQGRRIADQIKKEYGKEFYQLPESMQDDIIADKVMQKMRKGELITHPSDKRKYKDVMGFAANISNTEPKTYKDNNGNEYTYLDDGNEITPEFLDSLSTQNRLIYNTEFNLAKTDDKEIIDRYAKQYYDGESYTKEDLDNGVNSGDLIYVKSYTRSDGTKVSGYYRRKG